MERSRRRLWLVWPLAAGISLAVGAPAGAQAPSQAAPPEEPQTPSPTATASPVVGNELVVQVSGEPAADYRTGEPIDPDDAELARGVAKRSRGLAFSSRLSRAARAYAAALAPGEQESFPEEFLEFVLHFAGCPDARATGSLVYTTEDDGTKVWDHLQRTLAVSPGFTHVGIGRVPHVGERYRWRWAILLTERRFQLRPLAASGATGEHLVLTFKLAEGLRKPQVIVQSPGGTQHDSSLTPSEGWWTASLKLGPGHGTQPVEILAEGAFGPTVIALFPIAVGGPPPRVWRGARRAVVGAPSEPGEAARAMAELVNGERRRNGLAPLTWDDTVASIALRHSQDMEANGFLGHSSPTAGDLKARLISRGVRVYYAAENISNTSSVAAAHASLMRSPGHRGNILSPKPTHLGIGIVTQVKHGRESLIVTQIFARPIRLLPPAPRR